MKNNEMLCVYDKEYLGLKESELSYLDRIRNKSKQNHLNFDEFTEFS